MDVRVGVTDLVKLGAKLVGHKLIQYRLSTTETIVLPTKYGQIRGLQRKTIYDEELYYAFEGIPYAKPPINGLRFRAPEPPESWQSIRDCTYFRAKPLQRHFILGNIEGSEDCLYLNVYVKKLQKTGKPLPVMVWLYGGGFQTGEATRDLYGPDYFMKHDVVFITVNYRVGALGFLTLSDPDIDVPGNAGLKDQVMALRWIKENITFFNGDANNITIVGESAGAASAHIMLLSEQSRGLFHKVIMQSGSALCSWAQTPTNERWGYRLAKQMGYKGTHNDKEVFRFLSRASARDIAANDQCIITQSEKRDYLIFAFGPVVEPYITEHCVLPKPHVEMLKTGWGNNLPMIIGGTSFEGLFSFQTIRDDPYMLGNFEALIPRAVRDVSTTTQIQQMTNALKTAYFDDTLCSSMDFYECLHILSIKHFWHDMHRTVLARLAYTPKEVPTYLYRFDFDSPHFNHYRILVCGKQQRGVSHADDISYMFYNIMSTKLSKDSLEYQTIERFVGMWYAFAKKGNPNCQQIKPTLWQPIDESSVPKCLNISSCLELIDLPETKQFNVWDNFYKTKDLPLY